MRRRLGAAVLAAGMLAATAACGGDDGRSTEELCQDLNATLDPLDAELNAAMSQAGLAAGQGDEAALAEAAVELDGIVSEVTGALWQAADEADDDEFRAALESFAVELEGMASEIQSGTVPDTQAFQEAAAGVSQYCD